MVVPRADPPVGTRGRPLRDLFFSGLDGRSQLPALAVVVEKGRVPFGGKDGLFEEVTDKALHSGRRGVEAIESFSNWVAKLETFRSFIIVEFLAAEVKLDEKVEQSKMAALWP